MWHTPSQDSLCGSAHVSIGENVQCYGIDRCQMYLPTWLVKFFNLNQPANGHDKKHGRESLLQV